MSNTNTKGVWRHWDFLTGDVSWEDYGGKWVRQDPNNSDRYYVIDVYGAANIHDDPEPHWARVDLIDFADVDQDMIDTALSGYDLDLDEFEPEARRLVIVEALQGYGSAARLEEFTHRHRADVVRAQARRYVEELLADSDQVEALLDAPCNGVGSTRREMARGDVFAGIERGVFAGDATARLMAKIYGAPQEAIDDARPADFLPYFMGYTAAMSGAERETDPDLAPEYGQGYERGERVKAGECPAPGWIRQG